MNVDSKEVTIVIEWLRSQCEGKDIGEMKALRRIAHNRSGVMLNHSVPGKVRIGMKDCIDNDIHWTTVDSGNNHC